MTQYHRSLFILGICVLLAGVSCSDEDTDSSPTTRGEACQTLGLASCDRSLTCNLTFTDRDLCTDLIVSTCCERDSTCAETLSDEEAAQFEQCTSDVTNDECEGFGSPPPASCSELGAGL